MRILLNPPQDLLLFYARCGGLGSERAALSATISYYIKKFLTIPVILRIVMQKHIRTLHTDRAALHPACSNPVAAHGGGRQSALLLALSRKQQVCVEQSKQIEKSKGGKKKVQLHWIDLSAWCQRNGFFSPVRQSSLQIYDVSTD